MRDDCETVVGLIFGVSVVSVCAFVMIIIGGIVISDYCETRSYASALCSGTELNNLDINSGAVASRGTIDTCVVVSKTDTNCSYAVQLFFPPIKHYLLVGEDRQQVESWAASLGATKTFGCRVDGARGISDTFSRIAGYVAMVVIAILLLALVIVGVVFIMKKF